MDEENKVLNISNQLNNDIDRITQCLESFKESIDKIQGGTNGSPLWNGERAYKTVEACLAQYDYNCKLLSEIKKCSNYLETLKN